MKPGRTGTMTHDYKRHGTFDLFAALNVVTGEVRRDAVMQPAQRAAMADGMLEEPSPVLRGRAGYTGTCHVSRRGEDGGCG